MSKNYLDTADFRYQALTTLAKDWTSPYTGILHKKGAIVEFSAITKYTSKQLISFPIPNASAMYLKLSFQLFKESQEGLDKVEAKKKEGEEVTHVGDITDFYDLLEKRLASIIFAYTALEVFANQTIPDKYVYEKFREDDRCKETYTKEQAERWVSLDEKLSDLLPNVLSLKTPKGKRTWDKYKKLKKLRDRLIHPKSKDLHSTGKDDASIWNIISAKNLDNPALIAKEVISYFVDGLAEKPRWFTKLPF